MKQTYKSYLFLTIIVVSFLPSCKKDLDRNPLDAISSAAFWKDQADADIGLAGVYTKLTGGFLGTARPWLDTYSDNGFDTYNYYNFQNLVIGIVNNTDIPSTFYNPPYQGIASCNYFLENIDHVNMSDDIKSTYKAEVRFLRALFYFELETAYGGVVIYKTSPKTVDESKIAQSTKEEVLAFITEELDFAIANLPDVAYTGHAVKGSAMGLKARVLISQNKWQETADLTKKIIDGGKFSLALSYKGLFLTTTQIGNPEIMFSTDYLANSAYQALYGTEGVDIEIGWYNAVGANKNMVDDYEMQNGLGINEAGSGYDATKPALNRDPRFDFTIKYIGENFINPDGSIFSGGDPQYAYDQKYADLSRLPFGRNKYNLEDQHIIYIRYADILLMYAEAKNEVSGPDASVYAALNQIRQRPDVGLPPVNQTKYGSQNALRSYIQHERRIELAFEGLRYFDLKRWKAFDIKFAQLTNNGAVPLKYGEMNYVLPFSLDELTKNPQLKQNAGYPQ